MPIRLMMKHDMQAHNRKITPIRKAVQPFLDMKDPIGIIGD
jgi:hypothetical protein